VSDRSAIEWTDATWNPVRGCTKVSPGCKHCYAERFAERFRRVPGHPFEQGFDLRLVPEMLDAPLRWRRPRRIFVNSMSDLFHSGVPSEYIAAVFGVMAAAPQHTFQCLTKRTDRMRAWFCWDQYFGALRSDTLRHNRYHAEKYIGIELPEVHANGIDWPLPNVWLGVSVEREDYVHRIEDLQACPATVRFLSLEPLLGPLPDLDLHGISWVIIGGESGPGARPLELDWIRDIREQCRRAGVACFVKQLGRVWAREHLADPKGGDMSRWPDDLRVREMPGGTP
jgi:protein gp37